MIFHVFGVSFFSFLDKNGDPNDGSDWHLFSYFFDTLLNRRFGEARGLVFDGFWEDVGRILEGFWKVWKVWKDLEPKKSQMSPKMMQDRPKMVPKRI